MRPLIRFFAPMLIAALIVIGTPALGHAGAAGPQGKGQGAPKLSGRPAVGNPPSGSRAARRARAAVPRSRHRLCVMLTPSSLPGPAIRRPCSTLRSGVHRSPWTFLRRHARDSSPSSRLDMPLDDERLRTLDAARIHVIDGDTFAYGGDRIRIKGLNAPELLEPGGFDAMKRLDELLRGGQVAMLTVGTDAYGRTLAEVYVDDANVAETMKGEGHVKPRR